MKRTTLTFLVCLTVPFFDTCGQGQGILNNLSPQSIKSIDPSNVDFQDLQFLKEVLKNNRIVLLGEQSHGEGATFDAKVRLIKFLHQELNYEILSFESGLYDNYKAFEAVQDTSYRDSPLKESVYSIWSDTRQFEPLLQYVHQQKFSSKPLQVTGFDAQTDNLFKDEFLDDLKSLGTTRNLHEDELTILNEVISAGPEFVASNEVDSVQFFSACSKIQHSLEQLTTSDGNIKARVLHQTLISWVEIVKWEMDLLNNVPVSVQNPRDLQMARNLVFLSELYPGKKIIGWGASYHFANQIEQYKVTELTKSFIRKYDSLQKSEEPTNLDRDLAGAIPMGRVLKEHFGSALYSISFSSFEGAFGMLGAPSTPLKPLQPPVESIEYQLSTFLSYGFTDYRAGKEELSFYSSALGNLPILAPWGRLFDGHFFIKTSYPPSFPAQSNNVPDKAIVGSTFRQPSRIRKAGMKQVIDEKTKDGLSYANIYLLNTSKGVASNLNGQFTFNIPQPKRTDRVVFSSIGYQSDTLTIQEFLTSDIIQLTPQASSLEEIEIRAKPLSAKDIVKLAEKRISENYYQGANQQEFFYRVKQYHEDSVIFNEEAAVLVNSPIGYKPSTKATRKLTGKILQFRNTTNNEDNKNTWAGVGSLWLIYTHDLILDKDNVLHRPGYYDLTLNGITTYENRRVYDISFDCRKPGAYTTGFGYPAPISASGKLFIDVNTYTVLKIETLIQRKPYKSKRRPNLEIDPYGHQLIQTYKEFNGKHFLNYSKQVHFGKWTNTQTGTYTRNLEIRELLSTETTTNPSRSLTVSLENIKSTRVRSDPNFWTDHNIKIEDDVEDSFKRLGLPKKP